jgi:ribokinase
MPYIIFSTRSQNPKVVFVVTVITLGSLNLDLVTRTPRLPQPGETLIGHSFTTTPGGKGANQAIATARLNVPTRMIGRVGNDSFGQTLLANLQNSQVNCDDVLIDPTVTSGVAAIAIDDKGENNIIVTPGANGRVGDEELARLQQQLSTATVLLLQLEVPLEVIVQAAKLAHTAGVTVILDPAPAPDTLPDDLYPVVNILTPNQSEAARLVGFEVTNIEAAAKAADVLRSRGTQTVIIKLGGQGAWCATATESFLIPSFPVTVVDTVAAGDAFNGGLAAGLAEGLSLREAGRWAAAVGAIAVSRAGAQAAMPTREEVEELEFKIQNSKFKI